MRALTDRELDAVGGGGFSFTQSIYNRQSNYASVSQSSIGNVGYKAGNNSSYVSQSNSANNQNIFSVSF
jgi:hypothetical protein